MTTDAIYGIELMVNPRSMGSNLSKIVNRTPTMTSFHEDHWGEELDTISLQGTTAAFIMPSTAPDQYGLIANDSRRTTIAYHQFKRLIDLIRLNGCFFDNFGRVIYRYSVLLSYGQQAYKGFFESIDVTEMASDPYRFTYTITFKSEGTLYNYSAPGNSTTVVLPPPALNPPALNPPALNPPIPPVTQTGTPSVPVPSVPVPSVPPVTQTGTPSVPVPLVVQQSTPMITPSNTGIHSDDAKKAMSQLPWVTYY
jgi:hypothetical protein